MLAPRQGDTDFVKILDFGLAKLAPEALEEDSEGPGQVLTRHGSVFGTPRYMAPEQCVGSDVDERADLYALGLILYEALTGLHPFEEREPRRMIKHQLFTPVPPMKTRAPAVSVPASMEALVMRLVEKARSKRFASATEVLTALAAVCEKEGIQPPEPSSRFPTPRLAAPAGRPGSPPPRGVPSDAMATQDVSDAGATQDALSSTDQTQDALSSTSQTQDVLPSLASTPELSCLNPAPELTPSESLHPSLPQAAKAQDLPPNQATRPPVRQADKTQDLPADQSTQPLLREADKTQDLPADQSTQPLLREADKTQDLPSNNSTQLPLRDADKTQDLPSNNSTQPPLRDADKAQDRLSNNATQPLLRQLGQAQDPPPDDSTQPPPPPAASEPPSGRATALVAADRIPTELPRAASAIELDAQTAAPGRPAPLLRPRAVVLLAAVVVLGAIFALYPRRSANAPGPGKPTVPAPVRASSAPETPPPPPPPALAPKAELARASAMGIPALQQLQASYPTDPAVPRALAQAYATQRNGLEALRWQKKALALDANSVPDGELTQAANLALSGGETADPALALLEQELGTRGLDVLIALANKPGRLKSRIGKRLARSEVRAHAAPAALIALDLSGATRCEAKRTLLARAARDGDARTLQQLKQLTATRGCGVLGLSDCWPCLRKDGALRSAIAAIMARVGATD